MKFSCTKENLSQALAVVSGVASRNTNLPILNNVLIRADQQKTEIIATNLELAVAVSVRSKTEQSGAYTVPARTITEVASLIIGDRVDLELKETELSVASGRTATKIKGSPADEFPIIPALDTGEGYVAAADDLKTALAQVLPAAAKNDIRPELAGVLFNFSPTSGGLILAATDSYRLAERKISLQQGKSERRVIVPLRSAQEIAHTIAIMKTAEEVGVRILVGENQLVVSYGSVQIISRLTEGQYPDYTQIIPQEFKTTATVNTEQLAKEMKAASLFTVSGINAVTLRVPPEGGVVEIVSTSTQTGDYNSQLTAETSGGENSAILNSRYVLDGLSNMGTAQTDFQLISSDSPCVFRPHGNEEFRYVVMPIRQ